MFKYGPLLAYTFAMRIAAFELLGLYDQLMKEIEKNDFSLLDLIHHVSAGYKAVFSKITFEGIDLVRQSCGGAGFLGWSGLPSLLQDNAPNTTVEGDNTVML